MRLECDIMPIVYRLSDIYLSPNIDLYNNIPIYLYDIYNDYKPKKDIYVKLQEDDNINDIIEVNNFGVIQLYITTNFKYIYDNGLYDQVYNIVSRSTTHHKHKQTILISTNEDDEYLLEGKDLVINQYLNIYETPYSSPTFNTYKHETLKYHYLITGEGADLFRYLETIRYERKGDVRNIIDNIESRLTI